MKKHYVIGLAMALSLGLTACQGQTAAEPQSTAAEIPTSVEIRTSEVAETEAQAAGSGQGQAETSGEQEDNVSGAAEAPEETADADENTETAENGSGVLVAYFSYGENAELPDGVDASSSASIQMWNGEVTGNTGLIAHMIGEAVDAELFSIRTAEKYPATYDATIEQGQAENTENARPELATHIEDFESCQTVFVGFPNW